MATKPLPPFIPSPDTGQQPGPSQVQVGSIDFTDDALYQEPEPDTIFEDYLVNSYYHKCPHIYMMGISSPGGFQGDTCAFVQLANQTVLWVVDWTASMLGKQPTAPNSAAPQGWVLLHEEICPVMLSVAADGETPSYRLNGTYLYGCRRPKDLLVNNVSYPLPPWLQPVFDRTQPQDRMVVGIISPDSPDLQRVR